MKNKQQTNSKYFIGSFAKIENYKSLKTDLMPFFDGRYIKEKNLHMVIKWICFGYLVELFYSILLEL